MALNPLQRTGRVVSAAVAAAGWASVALAQAPSTPAQPSSPEATPPSVDSSVKTDASEEEENEARKRYARGLELYEENSYEAALVEFERAYKLSGKHFILRSIGLAQIALRNFVQAEEAFEQYLEDGGSEIPAEKREEAQAHLDKLRARIGSVHLDIAPEGASVSVDGAVVGTAPLEEPVRVDAGERRIAVSRDGYKSETRTLSVAGGETIDAQVELQLIEKEKSEPSSNEAPTAKPAANPVLSARSGSTSQPDDTLDVPWVTIGWISTGALAASATVTGVLALTSSNSLEESRESEPTRRAELKDQSDRTSGLALATDVLAGATLVVGGLTLVKMLIDADDHEERRQKAGVDVRIKPGAVDVVGRF